MEKRNFIGMAEAGEPLTREAIEAMKHYHGVQDRDAPAEKVERFRLLAESLFEAVSDYQCRLIAKVPARIWLSACAETG